MSFKQDLFAPRVHTYRLRKQQKVNHIKFRI